MSLCDELCGCPYCEAWELDPEKEETPVIKGYLLSTADLFKATLAGTKTHEIRELGEEAPFEVGDLIVLEEFANQERTGNRCVVQVTFVSSLVLNPAYQVFSIRLIEAPLGK